MSRERRREARLVAQDTASHLRVAEEIFALGLEVSDVSASGAFIRTEKPLPAGTRVELELVRAGLGRTVRVTGEVVQGQGGPRRGMAVRFDAVLGDAATRLSALLETLEAEPGVAAEDDSPLVMMGQVRELLGDLDETTRELARVDERIRAVEEEILAIEAESRELSARAASTSLGAGGVKR